MRRRLLNVLTAVSLVLCVAATGLWARSYWVHDVLGWGEVGRREGVEVMTMRSVAWSRGRLAMAHRQVPERHGPYYIRYTPGEMAGYRGTWLNRLGFYFDRTQRGGGGAVIVPAWSILVLTGAFPAVRFARWVRRRRRSRAGHCPVCGYDLRATPERCPECGAAVAVAEGRGSDPLADKSRPPRTRTP